VGESGGDIDHGARIVKVVDGGYSPVFDSNFTARLGL